MIAVEHAQADRHRTEVRIRACHEHLADVRIKHNAQPRQLWQQLHADRVHLGKIQHDADAVVSPEIAEKRQFGVTQLSVGDYFSGKMISDTVFHHLENSLQQLADSDTSQIENSQ